MKRLTDYAGDYLQTADWKILALLKTCLFAVGLGIGCLVPEKRRKPVFLASLGVYLLTYLPLMARFFWVVLRGGKRMPPDRAARDYVR